MNKRGFILLIWVVLLCRMEVFAVTFIPPGTTSLDKKAGSYIDVAEITVHDWCEYLQWLKANKGIRSEEYINALPDSAICEKLYGAVRYFQHPKYRNYPIVGLTYEQATNYCQWRSDRVNEKMKKGKVIYTLPDVYDLQMAYKKQKSPKKLPSTIVPINKKSRKISGIGYNVQEYTADPNVVLIGMEGKSLMFDDFTGVNHLLGFRCKALIIK